MRGVFPASRRHPLPRVEEGERCQCCRRAALAGGGRGGAGMRGRTWHCEGSLPRPMSPHPNASMWSGIACWPLTSASASGGGRRTVRRAAIGAQPRCVASANTYRPGPRGPPGSALATRSHCAKAHMALGRLHTTLNNAVARTGVSKAGLDRHLLRRRGNPQPTNLLYEVCDRRLVVVVYVEHRPVRTRPPT